MIDLKMAATAAMRLDGEASGDPTARPKGRTTSSMDGSMDLLGNSSDQGHAIMN